jgi:hypothetical protein
VEFLFAASILFTLPIILVGLYESDRIMKILKQRFPKKWRESGYPCGYFKVPSELGKNWWVRDKIVMKFPFLWIKIAFISPLVIVLAVVCVVSWWMEIRPLFL